mmetsp:Transcript_443/g.787  ORF Transcript_443/g.787 Transcript_443/m.787 type:complete len:306 (+) Transcript_443:39-956(+)
MNGTEDREKWKHFSGYDFCMVFPVENGYFTERGKGYIKSLKKLGFEMYAYSGIREDKDIFVLIRAPLRKLRSFADKIEFKMKLSGTVIKSMLERGNSEAGIAATSIPHRPDVTRLGPYEFIYAPYTRTVTESLYDSADNSNHPFSEITRLTLETIILESRMPDGSQNLKIQRYLDNGWLLGCYPLHDQGKAVQLTTEWSRFPFQNKLPLDDMEQYLGQKCCMYFAFAEHFVTSLSIPALVGIPLQIAVFALNDYSAPFLPYFSFFIALWAVFMLEHWKRKEKTIALQWGSIDFEQKEEDRPADRF